MITDPTTPTLSTGVEIHQKGQNKRLRQREKKKDYQGEHRDTGLEK